MDGQNFMEMTSMEKDHNLWILPVILRIEFLGHSTLESVSVVRYWETFEFFERLAKRDDFLC